MKNKYIVVSFLISFLIVLFTYFSYLLGFDPSFIFTVLGTLIMICTVCALYYQNDQISDQIDIFRKQTDISENSSFYQMALDIDNAFLDNYDLWPYFYKNKEIETNCKVDKLSKIEALAFLKLDFFESVVNLYKRNVLKKSWDDYFIDDFKNSPALRTFYKKREKWYKPNLQIFFDKAIKELNSKKK